MLHGNNEGNGAIRCNSSDKIDGREKVSKSDEDKKKRKGGLKEMVASRRRGVISTSEDNGSNSGYGSNRAKIAMVLMLTMIQCVLQIQCELIVNHRRGEKLQGSTKTVREMCSGDA